MVATIRDYALPAARSQPGFRGALVLGDAPTDSALVISFWQRAIQERMSAHASNHDDLLRARIAELGYQYDRDRLDVLLAEWPHTQRGQRASAGTRSAACGGGTTREKAGMWVVIAAYVTEPRWRATFRTALCMLAVDALANDPGCRRFDIMLDPVNPDRTVVYEASDDWAAYAARLRSPAAKQFEETLKKIGEGVERSLVFRGETSFPPSGR